MGAVERDRAGLASAVSNTARQAGNAVGVAAAGTVAGSPAAADFTHGFHTVALGAACLYVVAAAVALAVLPAPSKSKSSKLRRLRRLPES